MSAPVPTFTAAEESNPAGFAAEWQSWHQQRLQGLSAPHGFLAVTDLHWLTSEPTRFDGVPGQWWVSDDWLYVDLGTNERLLLNGKPIAGLQKLGSIAERDGFVLGHGESLIEAAKRGGKYFLRPRHPRNPLLQDFDGIPVYAPDPSWCVTGTYRRFDQPRLIRVGASLEGIELTYEAPGEVVFQLDGVIHVLTAFNGNTEGTLNILFTDATSGKTTYAASRSLVVETPGEAGSIVMDFNRAVNLPCAFTDLATCPLPPTGNQLAVAIEAGEQTPFERSSN